MEFHQNHRMTELNQITENILEMSGCLETKVRLQTDILSFCSVMNQVSFPEEYRLFVCMYVRRGAEN